MKFCTAVVAAFLASAAYAAPVENSVQIREEQVNNGIFDAFLNNGKGRETGNVFSDIFDSAACIVSGFLGGGNPLCFHGKGNKGDGLGVVKDTEKSTSSSSSSSSNNSGDDRGSSNSNSNSNSQQVTAEEVADTGYDFNYDTASNGDYKVKITPRNKNKKPCSYTIAPAGRSVDKVIDEAAKKCFA